MNVKGLKEITNPSEILISKKNQELSGNAISATIEGMRPFMIEVQALVSTAVYGTPQRSSTGYNSKRLNMLLAVLEKRVGFRLASKDVFLNITGGISVDDTALDLAVVAAIISSNEDLVLNEKYCFAAEIGLSGEIRPVQRLEQRITEAEKLGFSKIFISKFNNLVASLTFCPLLPIALLKFSSVRITSNFFLSKSTFTLCTSAGDKALDTNIAGSSDQFTISIFSPCNSFTTA